MTAARVAIVGSRNFVRTHLVRDYVRALPGDTIVISGGAYGPDTIAEMEARRRGLQTQIFPAEWNKWGRYAGPVRNALIAEACDRMVAFWDGESRGTKDAISHARRLGKPVEVIR